MALLMTGSSHLVKRESPQSPRQEILWNREPREPREMSSPIPRKLSSFAYLAYFAVSFAFYIGTVFEPPTYYPNQ